MVVMAPQHASIQGRFQAFPWSSVSGFVFSEEMMEHVRSWYEAGEVYAQEAYLLLDCSTGAFGQKTRRLQGAFLQKMARLMAQEGSTETAHHVMRLHRVAFCAGASYYCKLHHAHMPLLTRSLLPTLFMVQLQQDLSALLVSDPCRMAPFFTLAETLAVEEDWWRSSVAGAAGMAHAARVLLDEGFGVYLPTLFQDAVQKIDLLALNAEQGFCIQVKKVQLQQDAGFIPVTKETGIKAQWFTAMQRGVRELQKLEPRITWSPVLMNVHVQQVRPYELCGSILKSLRV